MVTVRDVSLDVDRDVEAADGHRLEIVGEEHRDRPGDSGGRAQRGVLAGEDVFEREVVVAVDVRAALDRKCRRPELPLVGANRVGERDVDQQRRE